MKTAINKMLRLLGLQLQGDFGPITCYTNKRGQVVWFLKAPPKEPATWMQLNQQNSFTAAASAWSDMDWYAKSCWTFAAKKTSLKVSGFNLFCYYWITGDNESISTIERQTGVTLPRQH